MSSYDLSFSDSAANVAASPAAPDAGDIFRAKMESGICPSCCAPEDPSSTLTETPTTRQRLYICGSEAHMTLSGRGSLIFASTVRAPVCTFMQEKQEAFDRERAELHAVIDNLVEGLASST